MTRASRLAGVASIALALSVPAFAQTAATTPPANAAAPPTQPRVTVGTVQKTQNRWRLRTIVGATIRSDTGQGIATVRDLLSDDGGQIQTAVLSVSGIGGKIVAVPFNQLKFVPAQGGPFSAAPEIGVGARLPQFAPTYGIVLPGATRASLRAMDAFRFDS